MKTIIATSLLLLGSVSTVSLKIRDGSLVIGAARAADRAAGADRLQHK
jgi:hypothetical protein